MADTAVASPVDHDHHDDHGGHHTSTGLSNNKLAMWMFLGSECLLFGGLISTYMLYRGRHSENLGPDQVWDIPFTSASSFVLLMSSLTMVLAVTSANLFLPGNNCLAESLFGQKKFCPLFFFFLGRAQIWQKHFSAKKKLG